MSKKYLYAITFLQLFVSVTGIVLIIMNLLGIRNTDNLFMFIFLTILAITQSIDNIAKIRDRSYHQWWLGTNKEMDTVFMYILLSSLVKLGFFWKNIIVFSKRIVSRVQFAIQLLMANMITASSRKKLGIVYYIL